MFSPRALLGTYTLIVFLAVVLFTGEKDVPLSGIPAFTPDKTYKITVLQTNDIRMEQFHGSNSLAMSDRKIMVDAIQEEITQEGGHLILLSGGDVSASIRQADTSNLNHLDYTAMTVGQHQFDDPLETIRQQQNHAGFPLISANIYTSETGEPLFDAYKLVNIDGLNIAIIGLTDRYTAKDQYLEGVDILDPYETASELVPMLKEQADIVIVSTHMGHHNQTQSDTSKKTLSSIPDVDLVLGDHSQHTEDDHLNDCGWFLTRIDLEFTNGTLNIVHTEKLSMNSTSGNTFASSDL